VRDNLGKTLYYEGILTNITDRKKFEIDLEISRQKYYHLFEFASDAIFLLDRELFIDANRKALEIFGCTSKKEILGKTPIDFSPEYQSNGFKSSEKAKEMIRNVIKGENQLFEWLHWTKDKKLVITEVNLTLVILRDKTYIQAIVRDISDRKEMEVQIIKEKEKALEADKLKTAFLSNISHEIRTPLNSIMGFTSLMLKHNYTSSEQLEMLNMINKSGNLLLSMINDIVDISKIETGQMKITEGEYHLNKIFDDIYNDFTRREDYLLISDVKFKLFKQLIDGDDIVQIDGNRLIRIIYTIIDNAFKFTNKGEIKLGYNIKGDRIEIYVSDTGIGIPVDKHKFIFDRFYTYENHNDKLSKGAGLGLPIAKELVQLMNGDIQVVSEPDKGSVFTIILPYNPIIKLKQKIIETDNKKQVNSLDDVLILVVEDDYNNYFFIQSLLKRVGMKHIWADNGYKAVELCHKYKDIKLILMDIRIPGIDGYQATKEIKIFRKDLPVIALTAYAMSDDRETAIMKGCDDYLAKPFYGDQLYELINKWLVK
nr:response regulator [Bacteroidales bacterium]